MNPNEQDKFLQLWNKYFCRAELPITFEYTSGVGTAEPVKPPVGYRCIFADLSRIRTGESLCFDVESIGCFGGTRYAGFSDVAMPNFEFFLSCGIPGKLEGERYKQGPELVKSWLEKTPKFQAPTRFLVFKRWDKLASADDPDVVIFFAPPNVLSGLFTLANFDRAEPDGVWSPFGAGCASTIQYPYLEKDADKPRAVLGLFDVSARPFVSSDALTFAVPMNRFEQMVANMEESFLITKAWSKVRKRIAEASPKDVYKE